MAPAQFLADRLPFFYGWVVLFSAGTTLVVRNTAASLTIAVFMYPLAQELGWSRTLIAGAASFGGLAASGLSPAVGWLVDRYGARAVLASSVFVLGLSTFSLAFATVPVAFYAAYGVSRVIFSSPIQISSSVVVSRWFVRLRGRASGILFTSHSVGLVAFPLIASAVIAASGWQAAWMVLAALVWVIALGPASLLIVQRPEDMGLRADGDQDDGADAGASTSAPQEPAWTLRAAMRTPALWILASSVGTLFLVQAGVNTHLAAYLRDQGLGVALAGVGLSVNAVFMGAGSLCWGWLVEKFPDRYVLAAVAAAVGGTVALFLTVNSVAEALIYSGLFGFAVGGMLSVPPVAYANYYGRRSLGAIRGVTEPFTTLEQAIGAVVAGLVFDFTQSYEIAIIAFAILGGLTTIFVLFAKPPGQPPPARRNPESPARPEPVEGRPHQGPGSGRA